MDSARNHVAPIEDEKTDAVSKSVRVGSIQTQLESMLDEIDECRAGPPCDAPQEDGNTASVQFPGCPGGVLAFLGRRADNSNATSDDSAPKGQARIRCSASSSEALRPHSVFRHILVGREALRHRAQARFRWARWHHRKQSHPKQPGARCDSPVRWVQPSIWTRTERNRDCDPHATFVSFSATQD